jgi:hypothetical protein
MNNLVINKIEEISTTCLVFDKTNCPCPTLNDLLLCYIKNRTNLRIYEFIENGNCVGIFPCEIVSGYINGCYFRHLKPIGWSLFDYIPFYCNKISLVKDFLKILSNELKKENIHAIHFPQLLILNDEVLKVSLNKYITWFSTSIFNIEKSQNSWCDITNKKSVRRHYRKAINDNYSVDIYLNEIPEQIYSFIAQTHIERWNFELSESAFSDINRINEYKSISNKVFMIIKLNGVWLAYHFGLIFGTTLLWHTPVINIKFLEYSPIEVLLYETAMFCKKNNFLILDFGLGDENYKARFCNDTRVVGDFFYPVSTQAWFVFLLRKWFDLKKIKLFISALKKRILSIKTYIGILWNKVRIYEITPNERIPYTISNVEFTKIDNFADYVDLCRYRNHPIRKWNYERFKTNSSFVCIYDKNKILSWGWQITSRQLYISEINRNYDFKQNIVLYDFHTLLEERNKGYYTNLLANIINSNTSVLNIYALDRNIQSIKTIERIGFKKIAEISFFAYKNK